MIPSSPDYLHRELTDVDTEETIQDIQAFSQKWFNITLRKHQLEWLRFIIGDDEAGDFSLLLCPRGHGKSWMVRVFLSYLICNNPDIRIFIVTSIESYSKKILREIKTMIESNEEMQKEFNIEKGKPWNATEIALLGRIDATILATTTRGHMTGRRADICLLDDAIIEDNINTPAKRRRVEEWLFGELFLALDVKNEKIMVVGTRKGVEDIYNIWLQNPDIRSAVYTPWREDGSLLWDADNDELGRGFTEKALARRRKRNELLFSREMLQQPSLPEGFVFNRNDLQFFAQLPPPEYMVYYMGVDPAWGQDKRASKSAYVVIAHDVRNDDIYVVEMFKDTLNLDEKLAKAKELFDKYEPKLVMIESVMLFEYLFNEFEKVIPRTQKVDPIHIKMKGTNEVKKELRIESRLGPLLRNKKIYLRNTDKDFFSGVFVEEELMPFGGMGTGGKQGNSPMDLLDALVFACEEVPLEGDDDMPIGRAVTARMW